MSPDTTSSILDGTCPALDGTELAPAAAHTQRGWRAWSEDQSDIVDWPDDELHHRPWHVAVTIAAGVWVACAAVSLVITSQSDDPSPARANAPVTVQAAPPPIASRAIPQPQSTPAPALCCSPSACFRLAQAPKPCTAVIPLARPLPVDPNWPAGWQIAARAWRPVPPPYGICYAINGVPIPFEMYAIGPGWTGSRADCNMGN